MIDVVKTRYAHIRGTVVFRKKKKNILKKIFRSRCKRPTRLGGNRVRETRDARDGIIYARIATRAINVGSRPRIIYCSPCTRIVCVHTGGGGVFSNAHTTIIIGTFNFLFYFHTTSVCYVFYYFFFNFLTTQSPVHVGGNFEKMQAKTVCGKNETDPLKGQPEQTLTVLCLADNKTSVTNTDTFSNMPKKRFDVQQVT